MPEEPMNRLRFNRDFTGGFSNQEATGQLPDPLPSPLRLNLGCGRDVREGFINIDLYSGDPRVVKMDIRQLEIPAASADFILASDILEHFSHREIDKVLAEWARVLKPGGEMEIRCPSLRLQMKAYMEGKWNADIASYMIFGGQTNPGDYHCVAFDEQSINEHLKKAGLEVTHFEELDIPQDKGFINLNMTVRAQKPKPVEEKPEKKKSIPSNLDLFDFTLTEEEEDTEYEDYTEILEEASEEKKEQSKEISNNEDIESAEPYLNVVWEGSQFIYHSLALINREICSNLIDSGLVNVTIVPYENDQFNPQGNEKYEELLEHDVRVKKDVPEDIENLPYCWVRHQWPPKPEEPKGAKWIIMQPWEFSRLRKDFVEIFQRADEIWTPSTYSRQSFVDSGVDFDKVQVIPNGIDPQLFTPEGDIYQLDTGKKLKFLFVGGTIFRKGIDILLQAFTKSFTNEDDVALIIKDMGGETFYRGQTAKENIEEIQKVHDAPEIIYIDEYLKEDEMAALYRACDVFVSPYRGEGFSLPTLEAMACGLPVIVTEGGATEDFTDELCAWFVPAQPRSVGDNIDGVELAGEAFFLEPDMEYLSNILKTIQTDPSFIYPKGLVASAKARSEWTWKRATRKVISRLDALYGLQMGLKAENIIIDEQDTMLEFALAEKYYHEEKHYKSKEIFERLLDNGTLNGRDKQHAYLRLAQLAIHDNETDWARELIERAFEYDKDSPDALYIKAYLLEREENLVDALETITPLMETWNEKKFDSRLGIPFDDMLCFMGNIFMKMEDLEGAVQIYTAALKMNPENPDACYGSALAFKKAGEEEKARTMLEWAVKLDPENENAKRELDNLA